MGSCDQKGKEVIVIDDLELEGEDVQITQCNVKKESKSVDEHLGLEDKEKDGDVEKMTCVTNMECLDVKEKDNDDEDIGSEFSDMMVSEDEASMSGSEGEEKCEVPLTDAEIEELVAEFLEVESKAAEAQESLEEESLARVESDVREELSESLYGDALEIAVSSEMRTFKKEWEDTLDDLETQSSFLLEQLDGAGIELPSIYKWIESQAPNGCRTEAWKKRAHWIGSQVTNELNQFIKEAESSLQTQRPVRRQHGKLLEEGASGYLAKKFSFQDPGNQTDNSDKTWNSFNTVLKSQSGLNDTSFGSKNWARVYLASTPQQAANLGFDLPGVNEVEEIGELECNSGDFLYADAIANEKEIDLSEEQKRNFMKIREEDDKNITRKLQRRLTQQRKRLQPYLGTTKKDVSEKVPLENCPNIPSEKRSTSLSDVTKSTEGDSHIEELKPDSVIASETRVPNSKGKRKMDSEESEDEEADNKRYRTVIDIDDEDQKETSAPDFSHVANKDSYSTHQVESPTNFIDVEALSSPLPIDRNGENEGDFLCTACYSILTISEVRRHPKLQVIICESCRKVVEKKDSSPEDSCGWCGKCIDLLSCNSCPMLFCTTCVSRNLGEEILLEVKKTSGWQCCWCSPDLLHQLILDCEKALAGMASTSCESDTEVSDDESNISRSSRRRKKRIRRILDDAELGEETKQRVALEKARQDHLRSMQLQSAIKIKEHSSSGLCGTITDGSTAGILGDERGGYIVNIAREADEEPVRIPPSISIKLKPHQVAGIRFMWENIIQSVKKVRSGDKGLGCILAHTMGLGKTFQVIAFLYTAMRCVDLGLKTALVVTPINVIHNWRQEFVKWKPAELKPLRVLMLDDVARDKRAFLLEKWRAKGGVLLMGYSTFRNLSFGKHVKDRNIADQMCHSLQNGPDILVCDEAHMIKNTKAGITLALRQVKTQRRIALTGSPLQNNLMEYYCMVDFVRERFLGNSLEFRNRFQNPIENGQHTNSTAEDVKLMNERSHILYQQLKGFIHRRDLNVVKNDLPSKTVFVISVKLSPLQRKLYKKFLDAHGYTDHKIASDKSIKSSFFKGYQALAQIWNHPGLLQMVKENRNSVRREDSVENFFMDDSSSDDNIESGDMLYGDKQKMKNDSVHRKGEGVFNSEVINWWKDIIDEKIYKTVDYSGKMVLLLDILSMSSEAGDKALVFSQSLTTLDMIEQFLSKLPRSGAESKLWKQGKDWYRMDGSTDASERQKLVERFNDPTNRRVKCTLISTRAGSLGINLQAANRVVLVDGSWNPTHDLQSIFRVWRYGQNKPVYAYRLMAHGTMEEKIYKRQVTKEGLAARVVDRQQVHRTMSKEEILHLFDFGGEDNVDMLDPNQGNIATSNQEKNLSFLPEHNGSKSNGTSGSDKIMECLLSRHPGWIASYHEHESLLQENEAERLTKEEQELAWQRYQRSIEWEEVKRTVIIDDHERKTATTSTPRENNPPQQNKVLSRNQSGHQRKCSNLSHMLTLRSLDIKSGSRAICEQCSQEIGWEDIRKDAKR